MIIQRMTISQMTENYFYAEAIVSWHGEKIRSYCYFTPDSTVSEIRETLLNTATELVERERNEVA
jgi:hypothetical protein